MLRHFIVDISTTRAIPASTFTIITGTTSKITKGKIYSLKEIVLEMRRDNIIIAVLNLIIYFHYQNYGTKKLQENIVEQEEMDTTLGVIW